MGLGRREIVDGEQKRRVRLINGIHVRQGGCKFQDAANPPTTRVEEWLKRRGDYAGNYVVLKKSVDGQYIGDVCDGGLPSRPVRKLSGRIGQRHFHIRPNVQASQPTTLLPGITTHETINPHLPRPSCAPILYMPAISEPLRASIYLPWAHRPSPP